MAWFKKRKPEADAPRSATPTQQIEDDGQTPVDMLAPPEDASAYPRQAQSASFQEDGDSFEEEDIEGDGALPSAGAAARQRLLWLLLVVGLIALLVAGWWTISRTERAFGGAGAVGEALLQSQRLSKSASQAIAGSPGAFSELVESSRALSGSLNRLRSNLGADYADELGKIAPLADRAGKNASVIIAQQQALINASAALRVIHSQSASLLDAANQISTLEVQRGSSPAEISAAGQLVMLTERIGKSTSEMLVPAGMSGQAAQGLDKDLVTLRGTAQNLLDGNSDLKLSATHDASTRGKITDLLATLDRIHTKAASLVTNPQGLSDAGAAQSSIDADSDRLIRGLGHLQVRLSNDAGLGWQGAAALLVPALIALLAAIGLVATQLRSSRGSQAITERQRQQAEQQQREAKRINEANQAAILRLMNELQAVAEGDLTQQATVTEDITGAIADSVNYTVEELRALVGNVQGAVTRVAQTTSGVEATSTELLATSTEQLREIRETGQSVVNMATRINQVSAQAQQSAQVAHQSLEVAASGLTAVQNSIGGMNAIRNQIQETSKRIKRLGESSQEIGEITELIADITEQTNVLALNAAIQAASAGEAGRGFSVVAEEVQRLAERSADATRQIAALVKAIQTDTQDAIAAMERSTRGVVEGARLSDNAGAALTEIDRVSHQVAQLIEQISSITAQEAQKANVVAGSIQHIFAVTEQTGESTRTTANQVRELASIADELRQSVARFKIA